MPKLHSLLPDYNIKLLLSCGVCFRQYYWEASKDFGWPPCMSMGNVCLHRKQSQRWGLPENKQNSDNRRKVLSELKCPFTWELSSREKKTHTCTWWELLWQTITVCRMIQAVHGGYWAANSESFVLVAFDGICVGDKPLQKSSEVLPDMFVHLYQWLFSAETFACRPADWIVVNDERDHCSSWSCITN